ncbi:unnamed protein product [Thlaspi arvense]|uniref:ABC transporter domain-containing protein n=1 Tax=Thlaspi arvense TaxID=13288 RepID=A0AAU9RGP8_THLAR|nr:unnamed protein product [Thlaspi arvense]
MSRGKQNLALFWTGSHILSCNSGIMLILDRQLHRLNSSSAEGEHLIEASLNRPDLKLLNFDARIDMGTRVAILGPNGAAKSTLLNLVAGDLVPTEGEVRRGEKLRIGRYSQHFVDQLPWWKSPLDYLLGLITDEEERRKHCVVATKLLRFGIPYSDQNRHFGSTSAGHKAKAVLASISISNPHILLLDEPTNHLDMPTIDALAKSLCWFKGGVVLVSHDSRLVSQVCHKEGKSQIWVVQDDGTVTLFPGTFNDYQKSQGEVDESY